MNSKRFPWKQVNNWAFWQTCKSRLEAYAHHVQHGIGAYLKTRDDQKAAAARSSSTPFRGCNAYGRRQSDCQGN